MSNVLALQALELDSYIEELAAWSTISNHCCTRTYADLVLTTIGD